MAKEFEQTGTNKRLDQDNFSTAVHAFRMHISPSVSIASTLWQARTTHRRHRVSEKTALHRPRSPCTLGHRPVQGVVGGRDLGPELVGQPTRFGGMPRNGSSKPPEPAGRLAVLSASRGRRVPQIPHLRQAFTIIDMLVSIAVVAVLIALLGPSLVKVREAGRRVVCQSNLRQQSLGIVTYANEYRDFLPYSRFDPAYGAQTEAPHLMMSARIPVGNALLWDGLGILFSQSYLTDPGVYYCPSHWGNHPQSRYASAWWNESGRIVTNIQYRGYTGLRFGSFESLPQTTAMLADGLQTQSDYNHRDGLNVLRADYSVAWRPDPGRILAASLPLDEADMMAEVKVVDAWESLDHSIHQSDAGSH